MQLTFDFIGQMSRIVYELGILIDRLQWEQARIYEDYYQERKRLSRDKTRTMMLLNRIEEYEEAIDRLFDKLYEERSNYYAESNSKGKGKNQSSL